MHASLTVGTPAPEGRVEADQPGEKFTGNHIFSSQSSRGKKKKSVFVDKSTGVTGSEAGDSKTRGNHSA